MTADPLEDHGALTLAELDRSLSLGLEFRGEPALGSCSVKVDRYLPYICVTTQAGRRLAKETRQARGITAAERRDREDPHLERLIRGHPITLVAQDSPLEYDLALPWNDTLSAGSESSAGRFQLARGLARYREFYAVLELLARRLLAQFGVVTIYDFHSMEPGDGPDITVDRRLIDRARFEDLTNDWMRHLGALEVDGRQLQVGDASEASTPGQVGRFVADRFRRVLVIPTHLTRFYRDAESGKAYPQAFRQLRQSLRTAVNSNVRHLSESRAVIEDAAMGSLTPATFTPLMKEVDEELARVAERVRLLFYVNPKNGEAERKKFLKSGGQRDPEFVYDAVEFDINAVRRRLFSIPIAEVEESELERIFAEKQREISLQLTLLEERGRPYFLPTSMELFGHPDSDLHDRARRLMLLRDEDDDELGPPVDSKAAKALFESLAQWLGGDDDEFPVDVEIVAQLSARATCQGSRVRLKKGATYRARELAGIAIHEVGTHVLVTHNGRRQPLRILGSGFAGDTRTQEGIAMLMEFLHGALSKRRLRDLGARVIAVHAATRGRPFRETFARLTAYRLSENHAFAVCERAYRGGGFAKGYLYLAGLLDLYRFYRDGEDLRPLLAGRFALEDLPTIQQFMESGVVLPPHFLPPVLAERDRNEWPLEALPLPTPSADIAELPCYGLLEELIE